MTSQLTTSQLMTSQLMTSQLTSQLMTSSFMTSQLMTSSSGDVLKVVTQYSLTVTHFGIAQEIGVTMRLQLHYTGLFWVT